MGILLLAGCGDSKDSSAPAKGSAETEARAQAVNPVAAEQRRLEDAGFGVVLGTPTGAQGGLTAAGVHMAYYTDPNKAAVTAEQIRQATSRTPGRIVIAQRGHRTYYMAEEHTLTADERARFRRVVGIAEGER